MPLTNELTEAETRALEQRTTSEHLCDYPGCENTAVQVVGVVRDINSAFAVCEEHLDLAKHTNEMDVRP